MTTGQATKQAKEAKLTSDQEKHIKEHHMHVKIRHGRMEISYTRSCNHNPDCPVEKEADTEYLAFYVCPCPPCPKTT